MNQRSRPTRATAFAIKGHGLAIASVGAAWLLVFWLHVPPLFIPAVVVSAWYGGIRPGLFAALLSTLGSACYLNLPELSLRVTNLEDARRDRGHQRRRRTLPRRQPPGLSHPRLHARGVPRVAGSGSRPQSRLAIVARDSGRNPRGGLAGDRKSPPA
ncbi:MAG: DUF4118 domain-containing protein [Thermoanaerobaculia bacterium]|nr:DUF4118 domain-containing protein [Thermoanaerobaculia bacterium]